MNGRENEKGFTIVELVVSIIVGTIFLLAINTAVTSYIRTGQELRDFSAANAFVEAKTEAVRNAGYNSVNLGTTDITNELPTELINQRSASLVVTQPFTGVKRVDITVSYNDQGANRSLTYSTYIGELGVAQ